MRWMDIPKTSVKYYLFDPCFLFFINVIFFGPIGPPGCLINRFTLYDFISCCSTFIQDSSAVQFVTIKLGEVGFGLEECKRRNAVGSRICPTWFSSPATAGLRRYLAYGDE